MGVVRTATASVLLCFLLAACNTTDALTPQVDVGDGSSSFNSSPVTQRDTMRMAAAPVQPVYGSETQDSYHSSYDQQGYQGSSSSTLDSQADALRNGGNNPVASRPLEDGRPQYSARSDQQAYPSNEQEEADRRLNDQAPVQGQAQDQAQDQPQQEEQPQQQASLPPSSSSDDGSIRFLPIIGAPVQAVTPLSRQLGAEARSHGLTIKSSTDNSSSYILKGYLSAFQDGPAITVTYVWDVLDNSGARLHRIQGNESVPLKGGDPWTAVPPSVMQQIASKTIAEFNSWRTTRGG
ncbi:hypothetical protein [Rhizobium sp. BK376]|jgi:hypothetical protein|uniref:hypothetical protein n=1 Tax=Rhizobium sp. BK376 TaxID=2512149 RepID=UPI00104E5E38|nr:hypothetical protein [Rhizobium sp. BK376]TCR92185.1 hypothetical protein EV561_102630 [Rhizobium sp. BK376]